MVILKIDLTRASGNYVDINCNRRETLTGGIDMHYSAPRLLLRCIHEMYTITTRTTKPSHIRHIIALLFLFDDD